ncbi:MAG: hypothetical protein U0795_05345 [Pirellulales bacterium]
MARLEQDREDLIREATALVDRCELIVACRSDRANSGSSSAAAVDEDEAWVVGVRAGGAVSLYFGPGRVYHFNAAGELRRAYVGGRLWKAEGGKLVGLERRRGAGNGAGSVELVRSEMGEAETREWMDELESWLVRLTAEWESGGRRVSREVVRAGGEGGMLSWWLGWQAGRAGRIVVASRPHVEG